MAAGNIINLHRQFTHAVQVSCEPSIWAQPIGTSTRTRCKVALFHYLGISRVSNIQRSWLMHSMIKKVKMDKK
uniref:Uncharacterized protein n=1 Tax=Rhizophora mucronata TaxID=61149 RepID=A0A2P2J0S0_RHIMU